MVGGQIAFLPEGGSQFQPAYHTDRSVIKVVEGLIDAGIDGLRAWKFGAKGMDPATLKRRFGDRLCFEGGVRLQTTLPFGATEGVRTEVKELISVLGKGGGYILGPIGCQASAATQAGTPPENVVAIAVGAIAGPSMCSEMRKTRGSIRPRSAVPDAVP